MFIIKKINYFLFTSLLISFSYANEKYLILAEGNTWLPMLPKNLVANHKQIEQLPFSGFVMMGNSYTNRVMKPDTNVSYVEVWNEVKALKNLYKNRHNFMQIKINFPADFWDDTAWKQVTKNFATVAKVCNDLGFKGIVFDDEPYSPAAVQMVNFKFPTQAEIKKNPQAYKAWEKAGSQKTPNFDEDAYRNPQYSFKEHSDKITSRFKTIMQAMVEAYPNLTLLVYNGPSFAHQNSNKKNLTVVNVGLPREHENLGAIYTGLLQGLSSTASLHDMGESYRYREDRHFKNAYTWRKYGIAQDAYNNDINSSYNWVVPQISRETWSQQSHVGFMVFNKGQKSNYPEFDTQSKSTLLDIKKTLQKALKYSDKYVVYYCQDQDWLLPNQEHPLEKGWMEIMKELNP